jgi:NADH-quinone oxidoreductase subunit A
MQPISATALMSPWEPGLLGLALYSGMVLALIALLLALSSLLGQRRPTPEKLRPYESGIIPTGSARLRYPVPFYLVAIFFLIFDVEGAFILTWAVAARDLGWDGWLRITFFILLLLLGLAYIWKRGGLDWGPTLKKDG